MLALDCLIIVWLFSMMFSYILQKKLLICVIAFKQHEVILISEIFFCIFSFFAVCNYCTCGNYNSPMKNVYKNNWVACIGTKSIDICVMHLFSVNMSWWKLSYSFGCELCFLISKSCQIRWKLFKGYSGIAPEITIWECFEWVLCKLLIIL